MSARLLKFCTALWAFEGIVVFADHSECAAESDADLACWAVAVAELNTSASHVAGFDRTIVKHQFRLSETWLARADRETRRD
jgi:hypothetical protein